MHKFETYILNDIIEKFIDYRGKTPPKISSGIPLVTAKIIKNGRILAPQEYIAEDYYDEWMTRGIPKKGDVIITTEAPMGEVAQVKTNKKLAFAQRLIILQANHKIIDENYLLYTLQSRDMQYRLGARMTGTTVTGIKSAELKKVKIDLPPLPVQRRIAAILSSLDDKIENNRKTCEKLEEIAQALFKRWFVDFEFLNEDGLPYKSSGGEMVNCEELGKEIPKGWEVGIVDDIAQTIITGKTPSANIENRFGNYMQFVTIPDLHQGSFINRTERYLSKEGADSQERSIIPKNSIVVSCIATPGLIGITTESCLTNQQINSIICKEGYSFIYSYYLLKTIAGTIIDYASSGSATPNLNKTQFSKMGVLLAPQELINSFHKAVDASFKQILALKREVYILQQTRDALLPKLMSGELAVDEGEKAYDG